MIYSFFMIIPSLFYCSHTVWYFLRISLSHKLSLDIDSMSIEQSSVLFFEIMPNLVAEFLIQFWKLFTP